jgi:hypothetical protein
MRTARFLCLTLLLTVVVYETVLALGSYAAEREAKIITEAAATLKPGYTTKTDAIALFRAHRWNVSIYENACVDPKGPCESLGVGASNFPPAIPVHLGALAEITLLPLPPVKPAYFGVELYFISGVLHSINAVFHVGDTGVGYSRYGGDNNFRSSEWKYGDDGKAGSIAVASSGTAFDVPFPHFALNYMYSMRCVDARMLWPSAPSPTKELRGWGGCK